MGATQHSITPLFHYSNYVVMFAMAKESHDSPLLLELAQVAGVEVKTLEPLARHTSMKIGGPADYFIEVKREAALAAVLQALNRHGIGFCLLGNGSNVLVSDRGV